jgi:hypothetical protein
MSKYKLFAIFALGTAFALNAALPASARDRENKAPRERESRQISTPARGAQAGFSISGETKGRISVHREHSQQTPDRPGFMQKAECSGSCWGGAVEFTCWGESVYCEDEGGCIAEGGGDTLILVCED